MIFPPRFRLRHFTAKPALWIGGNGSFCGGSAPAPPASSKEQKLKVNVLLLFALRRKAFLFGRLTEYVGNDF